MRTKRLELLLPENHEIFNYPSGTRRTVAAAFLDIGIKLSHIENKLDNLERYFQDATNGQGVSAVAQNRREDKSNVIIQNLIRGFDID